MRKSYLLVLSILLSTPCFPLQIKQAVNNETISAKVSSTDVTRILVQGDRIQSVKGVKGAYTRENDNINGEIYIQPTALYQNRAFTVLINTELGRHFTLLLNPMSVPSDTLMLVPRGVTENLATKYENASPYEMTIAHLIKDMRAGMSPDGYAVRNINHKQQYLYGNIAYLKMKAIYQGMNLRGEVWEVTNKTSNRIALSEKDFYKVGVRAISIENIEVQPKGVTYLYRVVNHA